MQIIPIPVEKEIDPSDDLAGIIMSATNIMNDDILVITQKVVSKQEGRTVDLSTTSPSLLAKGIASQYGKDPRTMELILAESKRIVRMYNGIIITETNSGLICANAGVDESNVRENHAVLLPVNPDESARMIQDSILQKTGKNTAVIISDTFGRPFRMGQVDCAIGVHGIEPMLDYNGAHDSFGRTLRVTAIAIADELASAAELVMGKTLKCPAVVIRGYSFNAGSYSSGMLVRPQEADLFR